MELPETHTEVEQGDVTAARRLPRPSTVAIPEPETASFAVPLQAAGLAIRAAAPTETAIPEVPAAMETHVVAGRRPVVQPTVGQVPGPGS